MPFFPLRSRERDAPFRYFSLRRTLAWVVNTRSKLLWSLAGATVVALLGFVLLGFLLAGGLTFGFRTSPPTPPAIIIPTARADSRFRELEIPKPGGTPYAIIAGRDGSIWFTEAECTSGIGRRAPNGAWLNLPLAADCKAQPLDITRGPDGNVWFTESSSGYGRITPGGELTRFPMSDRGPLGIATGPDGNLWIVALSSQERSFIEKVSTQGVVLAEYQLPAQALQPRGVVTGPDGAIWFTEYAGIGRITTSGNVTQFPLPKGSGSGTPNQIAAGPDGNLWFVEYMPEGTGRIGRLTPSGQLTEFATPDNRGLQWITAGPDGAMWFTGMISNTIGRISMSGSVTTYAVPTPRAQPVGITTGPDGNIWFTESAMDGIGRIGIFSMK
jgi:virginiamycin B lyase